MAYKLRGGGLRRGMDRRPGLRGGDVDPMSNMANIVDAILVLSVGLMMALISFWNLDMSNIQQVVMENEITEVKDVEKMVQDAQNSGSSYTELGTVYQDPNTGKMYMLTQDVDKGASATGNAASAE